MIATKTLISEYVRLTERKRALEEQLKDAKARLDEMEPRIVEQFQSDSVQSMSVDGYTVYLNRKLLAGAKDGDKPAMIAALKAVGDESWSFLVEDNVNYQRLNARVRECPQDESGMPILPEALRAVVNVYEDFTIGARKGAKQS